MNRLFICIGAASIISCSNNNKNTQSEIPTNDTLILGTRINNESPVLDTINGKTLFTLNDNVLVDNTIHDNIWSIIGTEVALTQTQADQMKIHPNEILKSANGEIIGKTNDTLPVMLLEEENTGLITGYTNTKNFKTHTIAERALESEINKNKKTFKELESYINNFQFEAYDLNSELGYKQYFIYESILEDPSPRDRITLLFNNNNHLVAIIHSRNLQFKNFKTHKLNRGHQLTVVSNLPETEVNRIISTRNAFYNSVD